MTGLDLGPLAAAHPGARFGVEGIRALTGAMGPLILPVIKPQGSSAERLPEIAGLCARGGAHIVKEDHGLAGQPCAPFRERVPRIAEAVARVSAATGGRALYFANLAGHAGDLPALADFAAEAGAGGYPVLPASSALARCAISPGGPAPCRS